MALLSLMKLCSIRTGTKFFFPYKNSQNFVSRINKREENVFTSQLCTAQIYFFFLFFLKTQRTFCLLKLRIIVHLTVSGLTCHMWRSLLEAQALPCRTVFSLATQGYSCLQHVEFSSPSLGWNHASASEGIFITTGPPESPNKFFFQK